MKWFLHWKRIFYDTHPNFLVFPMLIFVYPSWVALLVWELLIKTILNLHLIGIHAYKQYISQTV